MNFTPMRKGEREVYTVDYTEALADGETIVSAVWSNVVVHSSDSNPGAMIDGPASIAGPLVSQMISAVDSGVAGVTYEPRCTATTTLGQILILPDPGYGRLLVTD